MYDLLHLLVAPCNRVQEAKRRAALVSGTWLRLSQRQASLTCTSKTVRTSILRRRIVVLSRFNGKPRSSLSPLGHSASTESIRPCQTILASFNSHQSDASLVAKENRQELLQAILDSWREYPAKQLESRRLWRCLHSSYHVDLDSGGGNDYPRHRGSSTAHRSDIEIFRAITTEVLAATESALHFRLKTGTIPLQTKLRSLNQRRVIQPNRCL